MKIYHKPSSLKTLIGSDMFDALAPLVFNHLKEGEYSYDDFKFPKGWQNNNDNKKNRCEIYIYSAKKVQSDAWKKIKGKLEKDSKKKNTKFIYPKVPSKLARKGRAIDINIPAPKQKGGKSPGWKKFRIMDTFADPSKGDPSAVEKTRMRELATMRFIEVAVKDGMVFEADGWKDVMIARCPAHGTGLSMFGGKHYANFLNEVVALFPMLNGDYENSKNEQESCMASGRLMVDVLAASGGVGSGWKVWDHYSRDDTNATTDFMAYVIDKLKDIGSGISRTQKDTWNPADIWLVRDFARVKKMIDLATAECVKSGGGPEHIEHLNQVLRHLFVKGTVVGVSLKLVTRPKEGAMWRIYNVGMHNQWEKTKKWFDASPRGGDKVKTSQGEVSKIAIAAATNNYKIQKVECKMKMPSGMMETQECKVVLTSGKKVLDKDGKPTGKIWPTYNFTIKTTSGISKFAALKYEPTEVNRSAARGGKTPVDHLATLLNTLDIGTNQFASNPVKGHSNVWEKHPHTHLSKGKNGKGGWNDKAKADYREMWEKVQGAGAPFTGFSGLASADEFETLMTKQLLKQPRLGNTKLMQLNFLSAVCHLTALNRQKLFNHMLMMAEKKQFIGNWNILVEMGHKQQKVVVASTTDFYGPFGKIS